MKLKKISYKSPKKPAKLEKLRMSEQFDFDPKFEEAHWLIDNLLPLGHLIILFAQSGAGKSYFLESLACNVAFGKDFCGFPTRDGAVYLIDQDTPTDELKKRLRRFGKPLSSGANPKNSLYWSSMDGYSLSDGSLIKAINQHDSRLVVIDSLHSVCGHLNPNYTKDMSVLARLKQKCLTKDKTIIISHHITEKISYTAGELMDENIHITAMGNSAIVQQADTGLMLGSYKVDGLLSKLYIRVIAKRQAIRRPPITIRLIEPDKEQIITEFAGYYEMGYSEVEQDILLLLETIPMEYTVQGMYDALGHKHGIKVVRQGAANLEGKGKLVLSRHKSNLFKYKLPG